MTKIERERIAALASQSVLLREAWLRERQEVLAEQLAANIEIRKRWKQSDASEINQGKAVIWRPKIT